MPANPAVRVGIFVFVAALLFAGVIAYLRGYSYVANAYFVTVKFTDAQGLQERDPVMMAGVAIGFVESVRLDSDQYASVKMLINKRYSIPAGSRFVLQRSLLAGQTLINIIPNRRAEVSLKRNAVLEKPGEVPVSIEELLPQGKKLLANLTEASEDLKAFLADDRLQASLYRTMANAEKASVRLERMMASLQGLAATQQDEVIAIVRNVEIASSNVRDVTERLENLAAQPNLREDISGTVASARRTSESLEKVAGGLEKIVAQPGFQEDIRETAASSRRAAEEAERVLGRVGRLFGEGGGGKPSLPFRETSFDALYVPEEDRFRGNLTTTLEFSDDRFLGLGIYDLGASNKLIIQPGRSLGDRTDFRYGLYASKLGIGLDHDLSGKLYGSLNLYDSYDPRLDVQAGYRVNDDLDLMLGLDDAFDENQVTLGVRMTR